MADVILKNRRGDPKEYEEVDGVKLYAEDGHAEIFNQSESMSGIFTYIGKAVNGGVQIMSESGAIKGSHAALLVMSNTDVEENGSADMFGGYTAWFIATKTPLVVGNVYNGYDILSGKV